MSAHTNQRVSIVDGARTPFLKIRSGPAPFTSVGVTTLGTSSPYTE